ncbi:TRAP transporter TAXI family solute receptor [Natronocella acetinitrilica]|uniref:TRAP transporter TAXI family solute receptor n=1 Tax=Natronocella acetinitrilica TaxID=414046 RepID=A0AAE3G1F8_9GAMM|nr:TAXI family TRAP transporter solute-binding subunit [Natronocella acetinitrilica]MCP1673682.1 TRAP transporter TAXI family solute receptor [Natronocella acetinitrilica]
MTKLYRQQGSALSFAKRLGLGAVILGASVFGFSTTASADNVTVATTTQGSLNHIVGSSIARVLSEEMDVRARVQPHTGESALLPLVHSGQAELGLAAINQAMGIYYGADNGRPQENLRILTTLFPVKVGYFVREDSDIHTMEDLRGKRVTHGYMAQGAMIDVVNALLANGGLTPDDVRTVSVPNVNRGGDDFASGRADAFFHAVGAGKVSEVDASVGGLRLIPLDTSDEAMSRVLETFPQGYRFDQPPADGLAGFSEETPVLAYDYVLVVGAGVSDDLVYDMTRTLAENKSKLVQGARVLQDMSLERMYIDWEIPTHPGAVRYYEEQGLSPAAPK